VWLYIEFFHRFSPDFYRISISRFLNIFNSFFGNNILKDSQTFYLWSKSLCNKQTFLEPIFNDWNISLIKIILLNNISCVREIKFILSNYISRVYGEIYFFCFPFTKSRARDIDPGSGVILYRSVIHWKCHSLKKIIHYRFKEFHSSC
jgi:hypothetical protein